MTSKPRWPRAATGNAPAPTDGGLAGLVDAIRGLHAECAAQALRAVNVGLTVRYLRFYRLYPEIVGTLSPQFEALRPSPDAPPGGGPRGAEAPPPPAESRALDGLVSRLLYSHLEAIVDLDDSLARRFYEVEAMRGQWSVRELGDDTLRRHRYPPDQQERATQLVLDQAERLSDGWTKAT